MAKEKAQGTEVVNPQPSQELEVPKARVLAEVFAPNGKIRVELLPPEVAGGSADGGSVDLQPLEKRVAALENAPRGEGDGNSLGVYDKSVYTKVLNESELTSEQRGFYGPRNRICRAAICWVFLSGIETGQDTAAKIVLEDGTVFLRLNEGKSKRNVEGKYDAYSVSFYNPSTLQRVVFFRNSYQEFNDYYVAQIESDTEGTDINELIEEKFFGRVFSLMISAHMVSEYYSRNSVDIAERVRTTANEAKDTADRAQQIAGGIALTADGAKEAAEKAKEAADKAKETADGAKAKADEAKVVADQAYENSTRFTELSVDVRAFKSEMNDVKGSIPELTRISTVAQSAADRANHRLDNLEHVTGFIVEGRFEIENGKDPSLEEDGQVHDNGLGNYLPRLFFNTVYGDVCVRVGSGVFKLLNKGLCFRFYRDESDSGLWHERQYYTFMDREVEVKVLDYRVDEDFRWKMVGEHLNTKSPQEQIKELLGLS